MVYAVRAIMNENQWRSKVVKWLQPIRAFPVENSASTGAPDICTLAGWIEMKLAYSPPTPLEILEVDLRNSQRIWLRNWRKGGGRAFTLTILNQKLWFLHDGLWSAEHLGTKNEFVTQKESIRVYRGKDDAKENLMMDLIRWKP